MGDLKFIVNAARAVRADRSASARKGDGRLLLATVVNVVGSSYRHLGARMLIAGDRWVTGSVSGGCLEADVVRKAWWCTRGGAPAVLSYDSTDDELGWGIGPGCNGMVDLLLQPCAPGHPDDSLADDPLAFDPLVFDPLAFLDRCLAAEKPAALATVFRSTNAGIDVGAQLQIGPDGMIRSTVGDPGVAAALGARARAALLSGRAEVYASGGVEALVEPVLPPPHLYLFGAGPDAVPLASLADGLGWIVTVCDVGGRARTLKRFPGADQVLLGAAADDLAAGIGQDGRAGFAVVMSHHYERDRQTLGALLRSRVRYIGVLGPKRRTQRMLSELRLAPDDRLHAPIGLDLGSETPGEIALAISAEIQATLTGAAAGHLRDRAGLIHDRRADLDPPAMGQVGP
jgi:xanthine dehydrogenase accessory factor